LRLLPPFSAIFCGKLREIAATSDKAVAPQKTAENARKLRKIAVFPQFYGFFCGKLRLFSQFTGFLRKISATFAVFCGLRKIAEICGRLRAFADIPLPPAKLLSLNFSISKSDI